MQRIQIRNVKSKQIPRIHLMDALVDKGEIYLELKIQRIRERISLMDIMQQIRAAIGARSCCTERLPLPYGDCAPFSRKTE